MPRLSFEHLIDLSDEIGPFARADHAQPRRQQGYHTADMARLVVAVTRQPNPSQLVLNLGRAGVRFLSDAQDAEGRVHERRSSAGPWEDDAGVGDGWGLSALAWGTVVRLGADTALRRRATTAFRLAATQRSTSTRAMAFAGLGAAEVLAARPHYDDARALLADAAARVGPPRDEPDWPWPEDRLSQTNAAVCEVLLAGGDLLDRPELTASGLVLLDWLLTRETVDGHLSPTPSDGSGPGDDVPGYAQDPVEVAAMADACARAMRLTGEQRWRDGIDLARGWFAGHNDVGALMWDPGTDGCYDCLHATGPDVNQRASATVALLTTLQHDPGAAAG